MKRTKLQPPEGEGINMTPMIDVVFQLLIFFMLCSDMSSVEMADLTLPRVSEAKPDEGEAGRQTINIDRNGNVKVGAYYLTMDQLEREVLSVVAAAYKKKGSTLSSKPVLIRADSETKFGVVQEVMRRCVMHKIYKISFGAKIGLSESMLTEAKGATP